jgi:sec-independent protein translocase protein TatA
MELAFLSPSPMELAVIAVIALLVLGPSRLPEAARSLGKGMKEMRDSFSGAMDRDEDADYAPAGEIDLDEDEEDEPTAESDGGASRSADGASSSDESFSSDEPAVKTA